VGGFEATFAVNHLAHYLLPRLLMPRLAHDGSVVLTTSDMHDPAGCAYPEIADRLHVTPARVSQIKSRASIRLRIALGVVFADRQHHILCETPATERVL
jgi:hypothetical protein